MKIVLVKYYSILNVVIFNSILTVLFFGATARFETWPPLMKRLL